MRAGAVGEALLQEDCRKHGGHHEVETGQVNRDQAATQGADCRAGHPVHLVQQRDPEVVPPAVDTLGDTGRVVDGKGLVAGGIDEIGLLGPHAPVAAQHGETIEEMPSTHHEGGDQRGDGVEGGGQDVYQQELQRTRVDHERRDDGKPDREARRHHEHAIGDPQEEVCGAHRQRQGKRRPQRRQPVRPGYMPPRLPCRQNRRPPTNRGRRVGRPTCARSPRRCRR